MHTRREEAPESSVDSGGSRTSRSNSSSVRTGGGKPGRGQGRQRRQTLEAAAEAAATEGHRQDVWKRYKTCFQSDLGFDRITGLAAKTLHTSAAVLVLKLESGYRWVSWAGSVFAGDVVSNTSSPNPLVDYVMNGIPGQPTIIPDVRREPSLAGANTSTLLPGVPNIRFAAGVDFMVENAPLGALIIADSEPWPDGISVREKCYLTEFARLVTSEVMLRSERRAEHASYLTTTAHNLKMPLEYLTTTLSELRQELDKLGYSETPPSPAPSSAVDDTPPPPPPPALGDTAAAAEAAAGAAASAAAEVEGGHGASAQQDQQLVVQQQRAALECAEVCVDMMHQTVGCAIQESTSMLNPSLWETSQERDARESESEGPGKGKGKEEQGGGFGSEHDPMLTIARGKTLVETDVRALVQRCVTIASHMIPEGEASVNCNVKIVEPPAVSPTADAATQPIGDDADCLEVPALVKTNGQVVWHCIMDLLSNACRFCGGGEVTVCVSASKTHGVVHIKVCVQDKGPGVAEELLGKLFSTPFITAGRKHEGQGLGLFSVSKAMKSIGGTCGCVNLAPSSEEGGGEGAEEEKGRGKAGDKGDEEEGEQTGVHAWIEFPDCNSLLSTADSEEMEDVEGEGSSPSRRRSLSPSLADRFQGTLSSLFKAKNTTTTKTTMSTKRALVIDDSSATRDVITDMLRPRGWSVDQAKGAHQGLSMLKAEAYQLVILDMVMPVMSGLQVVVAYRKWVTTLLTEALTEGGGGGGGEGGGGGAAGGGEQGNNDANSQEMILRRRMTYIAMLRSQEVTEEDMEPGTRELVSEVLENPLTEGDMESLLGRVEGYMGQFQVSQLK